MQLKTFLFLILVGALGMAGCGGTGTSTNVSNANATLTNANAATPAANSVLEPTKKPETATTNEAPTLGPVVNAYYDALKKKDAAAVKKVMAQAFVQSIEADMKDDKKTDLVAYLTEYDKLPDGKMEVRNEQIDGSKGVAEVKGGSYANWTKVSFLNEGGVWKISNEVPRP